MLAQHPVRSKQSDWSHTNTHSGVWQYFFPKIQQTVHFTNSLQINRKEGCWAERVFGEISDENTQALVGLISLYWLSVQDIKKGTIHTQYITQSTACVLLYSRQTKSREKKKGSMIVFVSLPTFIFGQMVVSMFQRWWQTPILAKRLFSVKTFF